jgi:hypothetical protein
LISRNGAVAAAEVLAPPHTDWLRHLLTVSGPAEPMARFRSAAAGSGIVPWVLDFAGMEEDWLLQLAAPAGEQPAISMSGAKILARRLREAAAVNHARALERAAAGHHCPFDLHRLVPVPPTILALGPEDAQAQAWLWSHWGTTRPLRKVRLMPGQTDARRTRSDLMLVEFWAADWSPWRALARLRRDWPMLVLDLRPQYAAEAEEAPKPAGSRRVARARGG